MTLGKSTSDPRAHQVVASHEDHVASIHMLEELLLRDRAKLVEFGLFTQKGSIGDFRPQNVLVHVVFVFLDKLGPVFLAKLPAFFNESKEFLELTVVHEVYHDIQLLFPFLNIHLAKEYILVIYETFEALPIKVEFLFEYLDVDLAFRHFSEADARKQIV